MAKEQNRREVVKILGLAGFSLYLPSCWDSVESVSSIDNSEPDTLEKPSKDTLASENLIDEYNGVDFYRLGDEKYKDLNIGFNLRVPKQPKTIALCKNTEGVASAVRYANKNKLKITIKSGGHSFEAFSSSDGGLQINLSLLNHIELLEGDLVRIGPACLLRDLYNALLPNKRIVPAGSCGTVGVGGLALGGGYGFFARKYGLSCDNVVKLTMVDAKGEILEIDDSHELMWALKGAGNGNYGVITDMTFKSYKAPAYFTRHRFKAFKLNAEKAKMLLKNWFETTASLPEHCFSAFVLNGKTLTLLITHYESKNSAIDEMIERFTELCDKISIGGPGNLAKSLKTYYGIEHPIYFKNASAGYYSSFDQIEKFIEPILERTIENRLIYQVNTLGGSIGSENFKKKSCYPHRHLPYLSELQAYWEETESPAKKLEAFDEVQNQFFENGIRTQYRNYPDLNFKDWEHAYYGDNYGRLQGLKKKYDPNSVFDYPQAVKI